MTKVETREKPGFTADDEPFAIQAALANLKRAVDFFDRVQASSGDERTAVGIDHYDWLIKAARAAAALSKAEGQAT